MPSRCATPSSTRPVWPALRTAGGAAAWAGIDLRLATGQPFVRRVVALSRLGSRLVCR